MAAVCVEPAERGAARPFDGHPFAAQPLLHGADARGRFVSGDLVGQCFGIAVDAVHVVVGEVEPVAHFLPWQAAAGDLGAAEVCADGFVEHFEALAAFGEEAVERDEAFGELRELAGEALDLIGGHAAGKLRIGQRLAQRFREGIGFRRSKIGPVDGKGGAQCIGERRGEVALVGFELREIGRADAERGGHFGLPQPAPRAQRSQCLSCKDSPVCHARENSLQSWTLQLC